VRLHPNWTSTTAASASDAAIIITSTPIGRKVGWFRHRPPADIREPSNQQQQQQQQRQTAEALSGAVSAQQLTLHIAGYPDNKMNGSMWQQCCTALDWQLQGNLLWHDCYARCVCVGGGETGSQVCLGGEGVPGVSC
jgi:V8-like Glu-specific endopeptidase